MIRAEEMKWSKPEKEIARWAFRAAYNRECNAILESVSKMAAETKDPSGLWEIHDYLTEKRKDACEKYDFRYSVLLSVFARLIWEGWMHQETRKASAAFSAHALGFRSASPARPA